MLQTNANTLITLSRILTLPMSFAVGWVSDRYGVKKTLTGVLILTGIFTLGIGLLSDTGLKIVIFFQPLMAVCFFPPAFSALSNIGAKETRNIMVSFTIPAAFLIGGGCIPTLLGFFANNGLFALGFIGTGIVISAGALLPFFLRIEK